MPSHLPLPATLILLSRFIRLFAYGHTNLILVLFLRSLGHSESKIGIFVSCTLFGDAILSVLLTANADRIGRRRLLVLGGLLMCASGVVFAFRGGYWEFLGASVLGVISPSGNEIGPFKAIEESTIAQLVPRKQRGTIIGYYYMIGSIGLALGLLFCGWLVDVLQNEYDMDVLSSYRVVFMVYAGAGALKAFIAIFLPPACELQREEALPPRNDETAPLLQDQYSNDEEHQKQPQAQSPKQHLLSLKSLLPTFSPETLPFMLKFTSIYTLTCLANGIMPAPWIIYFFRLKFHLSESILGSIFFPLAILCASSHLLSTYLNSRFGPIPAMIYGHIPAALSFGLIPLPSNVYAAGAFLVMRWATMDLNQVPRQTLLLSAVRKEERTAAVGVVNTVKTLVFGVGPSVTGWLVEKGDFVWAFELACGMGLLYAVVLGWVFWGFRSWKEREEMDGGRAVERDGEEDGVGG